MSDTVVVAAIGVLGTAIITFGGIIVALLNRNQKSMNGRLTQLLEETRKSSRAEGVLEEHDRSK
jgi:hypothetical protein